MSNEINKERNNMSCNIILYYSCIISEHNII